MNRLAGIYRIEVALPSNPGPIASVTTGTSWAGRFGQSMRIAMTVSLSFDVGVMVPSPTRIDHLRARNPATCRASVYPCLEHRADDPAGHDRRALATSLAPDSLPRCWRNQVCGSATKGAPNSWRLSRRRTAATTAKPPVNPAPAMGGPHRRKPHFSWLRGMDMPQKNGP